MRVMEAADIFGSVSMRALIDALEEAFRRDVHLPPRQIIQVPGGNGDRQLLLMSAFDAAGGVVKLSAIYPDNAPKGAPTIQGTVTLLSSSGAPLALLDGAALTLLRTAAASALASRYLSRPDSRHLLVMGTGALAPFMALAHCAVRPIDAVTVWGRRPDQIDRTMQAIRDKAGPELEVRAAPDLSQAIADADILSCATSSAVPLIAGELLSAGAFVDAVGSYSPDRRETDDAVVRRSRIFVDTREGALSEAGDILIPLRRAVIKEKDVLGDLPALTRGRIPGRTNDAEITFFKSVGTAIEDLAAARLVVHVVRSSVASAR